MTQVSTAERKDVRAAEKKAREQEVERGEIIRLVCSSVQGRKYMWDILGSAGVFSSTYNDQPPRAAFNEGRRSLGLEILDGIMQWCPDQFIQAMREANERRLTEQSTVDRPISVADAEFSERYGFDRQPIGYDAEGYPIFAGERSAEAAGG